MRKAKAPDPILSEERTLEIAGVTYPVTDLGALDIFRIVPILRDGTATLQKRGANLERLTASDMIHVILDALESHAPQIKDLLASRIGVSVKDFADTKRFPLDCIIDLVGVVAEDPNLDAFLSKAAKAAAKWFPQTTATTSLESSSSSERTAGTEDGVTASFS